MESKMRCPHCGRCVGVLQSTDVENSVFEISVDKPKLRSKKEKLFHCTCQRCKKEIYILMGFKN